ncbi:MAG: protein kinase [Polyangiaceae bacterium]|nr:protein kinase [Polyangiaceae bacterium]
MHGEIGPRPGQRERLHREGFASNRVDHPGVVAILDDGYTAGGASYLVMERLEGQPLDALADQQGGLLSLEQVLDLGARWLDVVAAAHAVGVVHRDLKPENVFLTSAGVLKVLDFGLASVRDEGARRRLTATGVPMGTPAFMPPEQALALWDQVDARSDVYAVGASLFTLLTGRLVHEARTGPELLVMVSTRQAPRVIQLASAIPAAIGEVLDRALRFRREERFADAGEMLAAFRRAAALLRATGNLHQAFARTALTSGARPDEVHQRDATMSPITRPQRAVSERSRALLWIAGFFAIVSTASLIWVVRRSAPSPAIGPTAAASEPVGAAAEPLQSPSPERAETATVQPGPEASVARPPSASASSSAAPPMVATPRTVPATSGAPRGSSTPRPKPPSSDPLGWK